PRSGVLVAAKETRGIPQPFFLALAADRKTLYSIWAEKFGLFRPGPRAHRCEGRLHLRERVLVPPQRSNRRGAAGRRPWRP
ncbi:MAG: hypothetical protein ACKOHK_01620, partial [Planctomycetia bacterium]